MNNEELSRQLDKINHLVRQTLEPLEITGHWAKYVCVIVSGFIENAHEELFSEYARHRSNPEVASFVARKLRGVLNPKDERFIETARSFDQELGLRVEVLLNDEQRPLGGSINSIMSNRHLIAHGRNSTISMSQVKRYLGDVVVFLESLETELGLASPPS